MTDVGAVIVEMQGIGIRGFSGTGDAAVQALDVIKKGTKNEGIPREGVLSFEENQGQAKVVLKRMSGIADRMSEASLGLREQLREVGNLLQEMDEAASEYRRISHE
jgi:hypothetical protein